MYPNTEVVLCPFLPDGGRFLLKFKTVVDQPPTPLPAVSHPPKVNFRPPYASRAPDSPSAEPSPFPSSANFASLDSTFAHGRRQQQQQQNVQHVQQMKLLNTVAMLLQQQQQQQRPAGAPHSQQSLRNVGTLPFVESRRPSDDTTTQQSVEGEDIATSPHTDKTLVGNGEDLSTFVDPITERPTTDQLIERQLRQLNKLLSQRRVSPSHEEEVGAAEAMNGIGPQSTASTALADDNDEQAYRREEKRQVIFVIANYLVLFFSLVALSAEIQSRTLPALMVWAQRNYDSVQNCAADQDAMMACLSNGDFSGLVASFLLWLTQSAAAKRIFLFGFDTPKKLWTVVYEALVTAVCWGTSYLCIRRGLNPNTRQNFLHKYWKDAVYGSLAGFNAAFMKAVLKNLVPQEVAFEALEGGRRTLKIFQWLGLNLMDSEG